MDRRPSRGSLVAVIAFGLLAAVAGLYTYTILSEGADDGVELADHIGEIKRLDEVLTTSARLYAATGDSAYRARYFEHVEPLDAVLAAAGFLSEGQGIDPGLVEATNVANDELVALETEAFELADSGRFDEAMQRITSLRYADLKAAYWNGVATASARLAARIDRNTDRAAAVAFAIIFFSTVGAASTLVVFLRQRTVQAQLAMERAKNETFAVTVETMMDVVNNALMELELYKLEAAAQKEPDFSRIDACAAAISGHLAEMGQIESFELVRNKGRNVVRRHEGVPV